MQISKSLQYNKLNNDVNSIYILKAICCIIVIIMHCPFPGVLGRFVTYFLRFPVPVFFIISGYFLKDELHSYKRRVFSTLRLIFEGEILCGVVRLIILMCNGGNFISFGFNGNSLVGICLFGTVFNGALWYLYASLWTYITFAAVKCLKKKLGITAYINFKTNPHAFR